MRLGSLILFFTGNIFLASCGPEADAREVCACFHEVHQLGEEEGTEKMNACLKQLDRFRSRYKNSGDEIEFETALDRCR
ncbi:MAG: hypothetical protein ACK40M_01995 [Flavobacteriales bacterium]